jgi:hypothetical protein
MMREVEYFYCPDEFWSAYGYDGQAHYVSIYWTPYGDEAEFNDGRTAGTADWTAFLSLIEHPVNATALNRAGIPVRMLGSSDHEANQWLVIDRETHKAQIAPPTEAQQFLRAQWPEPEPLTEEQIAEIEERMQSAFSEVRARVQNVDIEALMREQHAKVDALQRVLDAALERVSDLDVELKLEAEDPCSP